MLTDNLSSRKPLITVTMGDPCGIGPEILVKVLASKDFQKDCRLLVIGETLALRRAADLLGKDLNFRTYEASSQPWEYQEDEVVIFNPASLHSEDIRYGKPTRNTCLAVMRYIETAVQLTLQGKADAVCTCPIHKAHLHEHGFSFPGHTEFLQDLTQAEDVVMMLAGPRLRVALVTIHHPLAEVPLLLSRENLQKTIRITGEALLRDFGIKSPHVAVAALNPHAGEEGRFGKEESDLIRPALKAFDTDPFKVSGPYPADTLFYRAFNGEFDAVVAMYHDQGLIPVKLVHFEEAVNVSLGLPIIRTSVDHGTAYDLAGSGRANEGSLKAAIRLAATMARNRYQTQ